MNSTIDVLFLRRPKIDYISPPVCEVIFSSSSGPVIVLNPLTPQVYPTGLVLGGTGGFILSWNTYPGALCYSVYKSVNPDDAFGSYVIVAECIPNPTIDLESFGPGFYRVSAITPDGETPLSLPVHFTGGNFACPEFTGPAPVNPVTAEEGDPATLGPVPLVPGFGAGELEYNWLKDGIFFRDTTLTTKNYLVINPTVPDDAGLYNLVVSNDIPDCTITSEDIELKISTVLWNIIWDDPMFFPGNPPATQDESDTPNSFHMSSTQTAAMSGNIPAQINLNGSQVYTGPQTNCNLQLVISNVTSAVYALLITVDGIGVLNEVNGAVNGTYNFPFVVPLSTDADIEISITLLTGAIAVNSATLDGTFTTV